MKKVCISFKEIYEQNGAHLKYGGYIDFYDDGENDYYDLITNPPGSLAGSRLIACDGVGDVYDFVADEWDKVIDITDAIDF